MLAHVDNRITYNGNGNATEFAYQFKILDRTDIKVLLTDADGKEKLLTKDYYVDVEKNVVRYPGYAVGAEVPESERPPVLPTGWKLTIYREVPVTQETDLPDQYPFNQVEDIGDKLTMIAQQLTDVTGRSLKIGVSTSADIDTTIPWENGKSFRISDDGKTLELSEDPAKVLPLAQSKLEAATAQANIAAASAAAAAKSENNAGSYAAVATTKASEATDEANRAKSEADRAKSISDNIGNPVSDVTESNGTVTVTKANGSQSTFVAFPQGENGALPIAKGGTGASSLQQARENLGINKTGLPVGFEAFTTNPNLQAGWLPLLGGEYSRTAYADLWEWVQTQNGYLIEEAEWQSKAITNAGNVPFYSKGDGSTTFRVPALKCWVKGTNSISEIGGYLVAGLPNITGSTAGAVNGTLGIYSSQDTPYHQNTGALSVETDGKAYGAIGDSGRDSANSNVSVNIDASLSNPIYGASDTVQPPSIVGLWLVKAFGTVTNVGSADLTKLVADHTRLETIINELKNKPDKDTFFVPDYSNPVELTKNVNNTITYDGWLMPWVQRASSGGGTLTINIDGGTITFDSNDFSIDSNFLPVKKGSVVKFVVASASGRITFYRNKVN